jgi:hypothetical protein
MRCIGDSAAQGWLAGATVSSLSTSGEEPVDAQADMLQDVLDLHGETVPRTRPATLDVFQHVQGCGNNFQICLSNILEFA